MKVLFVPVSGNKGIGEYMRSSILAKCIEAEWPEAKINFVLSSEAPYLNDCKYDKLVTPKSPTHHIKEVNDYISAIMPDLVIFDAAGRAAHLRHAKKLGCKTVFLAHYSKKLNRGLQLRRLLYTDQIWISQPEMVMPKLGWFAKTKIQWLKKNAPIFLGSTFIKPDQETQENILQKYQLKNGEYILISGGSGGHKIGDNLAADIFHEAVKSSNPSLHVVQVWGSNYPNKILDSNTFQTHIKSVENSEFISLLKNSKYALLSGGDTLLQAMSLHVPILSVPISSDQPARIRTIMSYGEFILSSSARVNNIANQLQYLAKPEVQLKLREALQRASIKNGCEIAVENIKKLFVC